VGQDNERLNRAELLQLHQQYTSEIRTSLDFVNKNLSFYVGLMSAILGILLAALLSVDSEDPRCGCSSIRDWWYGWLSSVTPQLEPSIIAS
jgi:hypothetical protein